MTKAALIVSLCMLAACGAEEEEVEAEPAIVLFSVDPDSAVAGAEVSVMVEVEDFGLSGEDHDHDDASMDDDDDDDDAVVTGHVHIYWDSVDTNPLLMLTEHMGTATVPSDADIGVHVLIARLHDEDHLILEGAEVLELDFEVLAP